MLAQLGHPPAIRAARWLVQVGAAGAEVTKLVVEAMLAPSPTTSTMLEFRGTNSQSWAIAPERVVDWVHAVPPVTVRDTVPSVPQAAPIVASYMSMPNGEVV